jgi:hypothetical protein
LRRYSPIVPPVVFPALLEAIAKVLGNINEGRWQMLCEASGGIDAKAVTQCGTTVFLAQTGK